MTESKDTICVYHDKCMDGFMAATIVQKSFQNRSSPCFFYGGDYSKDHIPIEAVKDRVLIFVDFCYKKDVMVELAKHADFIMVIDHHVSQMKNMSAGDALPDNMFCFFDMDRSGAYLAWKRFFPYSDVPKIVQHVSDQDLWKFELPGTKEIGQWLFSQPYDFGLYESLLDDKYFESIKESKVEIGEALLAMKQKEIREFVDDNMHPITINGVEGVAVNMPYFYASDAGAYMAKNYAPDTFAAVYYQSSDKYVVSLRSAEGGSDVSELAVSQGGGGHKHAAGFSRNVAMSWLY